MTKANVDLCERCHVHNVYGWVDQRCCDGRECGCQGKPITPCWCEDCWARYDAQAMTVTHQPTMNLRFIEREVVAGKTPGSKLWTYRKVRILQQMFVPKDWSTGMEEYWQDVPFVEGDFSNQRGLAQGSQRSGHGA